MATRSQLLFITLALCATSFFALAVHAQTGLPGANNALSITFSAAPSPNDIVLLSVRSSLVELSESDILWQANGKNVAQGRGVDSTSVKVGGLGVETRIDVTVIMGDGTNAFAQATIIPTELDLLVDSDSYTPPFYRGRSRGSAGTNLHLQALPRFKRGNVTSPASELIYTWRRNSEVLGSISGRVKSTATIPILHLFGTDTVSVEAKSEDGLLSHTSSISLPASEPTLVLYQDHPLYGIMYHRALGGSTFIPETEMTFAAVPFFAQAKNTYDPALIFEWRVNDATVPTSRTNPSEITINADNSSGIALVEVDVTHATNYYLDAKGAWRITFSPGQNGGTSDLFRQ